MSEAALAWRAEAAFRAAWPAHEEIVEGDWCLRFAAGISRRANSVNALVAAPRDIAATMARAEQAYAARNLPLIYRVTGLTDPTLDAALAAAGFQAEGETTTLYLDLPPFSMRRDPDVTILEAPDDAWFQEMARMQGWGAERLATYRGIVGRITAPAAFFTLRQQGSATAAGFAVIHDGIACVESVVTDPAFRRQGQARRLLGAMLAWAIEHHAQGAALQVEKANATAIALYRGMGFLTTLYDYHYRVKA